ncbi:hypothetical protein CICLE_v10023196mg [Citrus x clementina]|uniref:Uncharacterized protein n=1 Tax=Citrus clementina TaxID=85681 RepID=V4TNK6_CITCL|nr:hypothetical protein CICLE_v10023196mg [Citrus x clementina]
MNLGLFQHKQQQGYPQRIGKQYSDIQMILVNDYECKRFQSMTYHRYCYRSNAFKVNRLTTQAHLVTHDHFFQ